MTLIPLTERGQSVYFIMDGPDAYGRCYGLQRRVQMSRIGIAWSILLGIAVGTLVLGFTLGSNIVLSSSDPGQKLPSSDARLVYLIAQEAVAGERLLTPHRLEKTLGVETIHISDVVRGLDTNGAVPEALLIHESALPMVDEAWLASIYRNGVVLVFFNVYAPELARLLSDPCLIQRGFASEPYDGPFYVSVYRLALGEPQDVAALNAANSCGGSSVAGVKSPASFSRGASSNSLDDQNAFASFAHVLQTQIMNLQETKISFESTSH